jgi:hypothetical protein
LAEVALKKEDNTEGLAFLYLISGESDKLRKLSKQTNSLLRQLWLNDNESIARTLVFVAPRIDLELNDSNYFTSSLV